MSEDIVVALEDLYPPGSWACAHRKGDTLPASVVDVNGWRDKVARPSTKAAQSARDEASEG